MLDLSDSTEVSRPIESLDGVAAGDLRMSLEVSDIRLFASVESTLDVAHRLAAAGAPAGTLVVADEQRRGRGRGGRSWHSPAGRGLWLTLIERPPAASLAVLTLRIGVALGCALDRFADRPVGLKWPNDLQLGTRKLAGVLVEARWRGSAPEWLAIGVGINVLSPTDVAHGTGLTDGVSRVAVLTAVVPPLRAAASIEETVLDEEILREFARRDVARGRACLEPAPGIVRGVTARGELLVETGSGERAFNSGSLVLGEDS